MKLTNLNTNHKTLALYLRNENYKKLEARQKNSDAFTLSVKEKICGFTDCVLTYESLDTLIINILKYSK